MTELEERRLLRLRIVGWSVPVMVPEQDWPVMVGPYKDWEECNAVREFVERRGYETGRCELIGLPLPDGSQELESLYLPK